MGLRLHVVLFYFYLFIYVLLSTGCYLGMQEGKLRVLQYDGAYGANCSGPNHFTAENMAEVE